MNIVLGPTPRCRRPERRWRPDARSLVAGVMVGVGLALLAGFAGSVRAAERPAKGWQIWVKPPNDDWQPLRIKGREPWTFTGATACNVDLPGQVRTQPSGTLIACRQVTR